jgi:hypothetical protein
MGFNVHPPAIRAFGRHIDRCKRRNEAADPDPMDTADYSIMRNTVVRFNAAILVLVGVICVAAPAAVLIAGLATGDPDLSATTLTDMWGDTSPQILVSLALLLVAAGFSVHAIRRRRVWRLRVWLSALAASCLVLAVAVAALGDVAGG